MGHQSSSDGIWEKGSIFTYHKLDEDGTGNFFETSQSKTDTPTLLVDTFKSHPQMKTGKILRIHFRMKPTNVAETYTLRLWRAALGPDYASNACMLYESAPLRADDVDYDIGELNIPFWLYTPGFLYYSIEWTGAPGNTSGFIEVTGEAVD
jgi:hypothetical protein